MSKYFPPQPLSVGLPNIYLGGKFTEIVLPNGVKTWSISGSKYIQEAIANLEKELMKRGLHLKRKVNAPLSAGCRPEYDMSPECSEGDMKLYISLIGILRWMVETGQIDLTCEVSMMASYCMMPRKGHLEQIFHMFAYLKTHHNSRIVLDPTYPNIDPNQFLKKNRKQFYGDLVDEVPKNAPRSLGKEFIIRANVDASFAGDKLTRISRTGFIIMINNSPVYLFSKK